MNDKEIEKGLECCVDFLCGECPYKKFDDKNYALQCMHKLMVDIWNLHNRQKEIEK